VAGCTRRGAAFREVNRRAARSSARPTRPRARLVANTAATSLSLPGDEALVLARLQQPIIDDEEARPRRASRVGSGLRQRQRTFPRSATRAARTRGAPHCPFAHACTLRSCRVRKAIIEAPRQLADAEQQANERFDRAINGLREAVSLLVARGGPVRVNIEELIAPRARRRLAFADEGAGAMSLAQSIELSPSTRWLFGQIGEQDDLRSSRTRTTGTLWFYVLRVDRRRRGAAATVVTGSWLARIRTVAPRLLESSSRSAPVTVFAERSCAALGATRKMVNGDRRIRQLARGPAYPKPLDAMSLSTTSATTRSEAAVDVDGLPSAVAKL